MLLKNSIGGVGPELISSQDITLLEYTDNIPQYLPYLAIGLPWTKSKIVAILQNMNDKYIKLHDNIKKINDICKNHDILWLPAKIDVYDKYIGDTSCKGNTCSSPYVMDHAVWRKAIFPIDWTVSSIIRNTYSNTLQYKFKTNLIFSILCDRTLQGRTLQDTDGRGIINFTINYPIKL